MVFKRYDIEIRDIWGEFYTPTRECCEEAARLFNKHGSEMQFTYQLGLVQRLMLAGF